MTGIGLGRVYSVTLSFADHAPFNYVCRAGSWQSARMQARMASGRYDEIGLEIYVATEWQEIDGDPEYTVLKGIA